MGYQSKMDMSAMEQNTKNNFASAQRLSKVKEVEAGQNGNQDARLSKTGPTDQGTK